MASPTFGHSSSEYTFDRATNTIYQGLESVKDLSSGIGEKLAEVENAFAPTGKNRFMDVVWALKLAGIGNKQIEILISIGYFKDFGNPNKLQKIFEIASMLKFGELTWLSNEKKITIFGNRDDEVAQYAEHRTEKNWRVKDGKGLIGLVEDIIQKQDIQPPALSDRLATWKEYLGYVPALGSNYRSLLYVSEPPRPLYAKKSGKLWAYSVMAISLRTAEVHEWTIPREMYVHNVREGDLLRVIGGKNGYMKKEYMGVMRYHLLDYQIVDNL